MPSRGKTVRKMLWTAMRIHRNFTIPELVRSVPGGCSYENAQKFVRNLVKCGYVATGEFAGGRSGEFRIYRLVNNIGPEVPVLGIGRRESGLVKRETEREGDVGAIHESPVQDAAESETETALRLRSATGETEVTDEP